MGYSFSLKNANSVGHLVEGNVYTFVQQCKSSQEVLHPNIEFLDKLVRRTEDDFFTSEKFWRNIYPDIEKLRNDWEEIKPEFYRLNEFRDLQDFPSSTNRRILEFLQRISRMLSRCKVESLLLPGFERNSLNDDLVNRHLLRELVRIHPGDTALILQL